MEESVKYIKKHLKNGFSEEEIRKAFKTSGWSPNLIDDVFNMHEFKINKKYLLISVSLILLIFGGSALIFLFAGGLPSPSGYATYPMSCLVQDTDNQNFYHFVTSERACCNLLIHSSCGGINSLDIMDTNSNQLLFNANVKCEGNYKVLINDYTIKRCTDPTYDNQDIFNL